MAHLIKISDIFLREEVGFLNMDLTMTDVAKKLDPPAGWRFCGEEDFPAMWFYDGVQLTFDLEAPYKFYSIKLDTEHFDGHISLLTGETDYFMNPSTLLLDHEGLTHETKPSELIRFLSKVGEAEGKKVQVVAFGHDLETDLQVGYGGNVLATFVFSRNSFDVERIKEATPGDEPYQFREIALREEPFKRDIDDPNWLRAADQHAKLYFMVVLGKRPINPVWEAKAKYLTGDEYLARLEDKN